jgi:hypothetical protein
MGSKPGSRRKPMPRVFALRLAVSLLALAPVTGSFAQSGTRIVEFGHDWGSDFIAM